MRRLALAAAFLLVAGCPCSSTWFRRCAPVPSGTVEECAAAAPGDQGEAIRACRACMAEGDSAATCSRRMWGR